MPQMTSTIDYKALAERVAQRAIYADNNADQNNKTWAADLRTVVSLLNGMAGQKPFAWAIRDGWSQTRFSVDPDTPILGTRRADYVVDALYLHPAPSAPQAMEDANVWKQIVPDDVPQAEPKREPLSEYARAVERAAYERAAKECELQITGSDYHFFATHGHWDHMAQAATNCAAAIRALGVSDD